MRAAIYARYSSDNQREASIEVQVRTCKARVEAEDWDVVQVYSDAAISGATTLRPGYQQLLQDARTGSIDVVIAEALDRLSRDLEDIAALFKLLTFSNVRLMTLEEGEITELHVGLKGTMNALYLKDLARKTRRGLEGRVRAGKSGGGLCYGYDVVHSQNTKGETVRGERTINATEAEIVRRIFKEYLSGSSPRSIAFALNADNIPGHASRNWGPSTIYGNWRRGTGILNNELYVGRLVWNRQRYIKDPTTGKRVARLNPDSEWVKTEVPELRIVPEEIWDAVKERQQSTRKTLTADGNGVRSERARRPRYLLSGLLRCGVCGGGYSKINRHQYGCSTARNRGTCDNLLSIRRDILEESILEGLRDKLMHPDLVAEFAKEYHRELNRQAALNNTAHDRLKAELSRTELEIRSIIDAVKAGMRTESMTGELIALEKKSKDLKREIDRTPATPVRIHPNLGELYRQKVANLREALNDEGARAEASAILQSLIEEIRLVPVDGELRIHLKGSLAEMLAFALKDKHPGSKESGVQITLVAGAGLVQAHTITRHV
jgi:site-specific DNA recombinase